VASGHSSGVSIGNYLCKVSFLVFIFNRENVEVLWWMVPIRKQENE